MRSKRVRRRLVSRLLALTFASVLGVSCGGGTLGSTASNTGGNTNPPPATAQLTVTPASMTFGSLTVGKSQSLTGTLRAAGGSVTVSSASWNGSGYAVNGITFPTTIAAGNSTSFTVTFTPQVSGSATGQVAFLSNAANSPTAMSVSGSGAATPVQHSVDLFWNASSSQVAGYNIYRGVQSGGPYSKLNSTVIAGLSFTDSSVQSGNTYYYAATAVDSSNIESGYSNIATATIP